MRPKSRHSGSLCTVFPVARRNNPFWEKCAAWSAAATDTGALKHGAEAGDGPVTQLRRLPFSLVEAADERSADLPGVPRDVLELQICASFSGQAGRAPSAGTDDGGRLAARRLEEAPCGYQRRAAPRPRPGLGRRGAAERNAHPARVVDRHRGALPRARLEI